MNIILTLLSLVTGAVILIKINEKLLDNSSKTTVEYIKYIVSIVVMEVVAFAFSLFGTLGGYMVFKNTIFNTYSMNKTEDLLIFAITFIYAAYFMIFYKVPDKKEKK